MFRGPISLAQTTISGTILTTTNQPIEFANITLVDSIANQLIAGTTSDENGLFELTTESLGTFQLTVQYLGYKTWNRTLVTGNDIDLDNIFLSENIEALGEIVVTASQPLIERKEDKLVVNIASGPLRSGYDGIEVLRRSPYIWVDSEGNILMRNHSARILINGRPLNLRGSDLANYISNLNSDNIKSIEIETTPSANSDASNLGGVINIVLKEKPIGFDSTLRTYYETFGSPYYQRYAGLNFNYGANRWNVYGSYNYMQRFNTGVSFTDISYLESFNYLKTKQEDETQLNRHNYQIGFLTSLWKNHEFGVEFFGNVRNRMAINENDLSLTNQGDTIDYGTTDFDNELANDLQAAIINYTWNMDTLNSSLKIIVDGTKQGNEDFNAAISKYNFGYFEDNKERNDFDNETKIISLQGDLVKYTKGGLKLELGAKLTDTKRNNNLISETFLNEIWLENDRTTSLDYQEKVSAFYLNSSKQFKEKHFVKVGIRIEHTDLERIDLLEQDVIAKQYTDWFPSVFYAYDLSKESSLSASYSRRLSRPAFYELNNVVRKVNDFRYAIGNPDLRPEYIDLYELKFQHKKQTASIYLNKANDAINGVYFLADSIAYYQRKNSGTQTQLGLQYNVSGDILKWWTVRGTIHLYHRKFTTDGGEDIFKKGTYDLRFSSNIKINSTTGIDVSARYLSPHADAFYEQIPYYYFQVFIKKSFFNKKLNCRLYFYDLFNTVKFGNRRPFPDIVTTLSRKPRTRSIRIWMTYYFSNQNKTSKKKNKSNNDIRRRL